MLKCALTHPTSLHEGLERTAYDTWHYMDRSTDLVTLRNPDLDVGTFTVSFWKSMGEIFPGEAVFHLEQPLFCSNFIDTISLSLLNF